MENTDATIDLRLPVDSGAEPVLIKEEHFVILDEVRLAVAQLNQFRQELGRVFQLLTNMKDKADTAERALTQKRQELASKYDIDGGQWAIDFENKRMVRLADGAPLTP